MSTSAIPYSSGATQTPTNYNFLSTWDIITLDKDPKLVERYGSGRISGLLEFFNYKKPASTLKYSHFEKDRVMPKIKATTAGAAAGAAATFTMDSSANYPYNQNNSPYLGSANTVNSRPARVGDLIMVKPASGTVSYTTIVKCLITDVSGSSFTAYPLLIGDAIPAIGSADEVVIYGNAHGEGSNRPLGLSTKATEYENQLHIFKDTFTMTDTAKAMKTWISINGEMKWVSEGERDALNRILNDREMTLLFNPGLTNTAISNLYAGTENPITMAKGLVQEVIERGNTLNYSLGTGLTISDMEDLVPIMNKQKCAKSNLFCDGISLDIQFDRELRDEFKNGSIIFGMFDKDEAKNVNLGFKSFVIGDYSFMKKTIDAFNELQTLGASGFNFPYEGMILPADYTSDNDGTSVPSLRMRYLQEPGGESKEMEKTYWNGKLYGDNGTAKEEIRYVSTAGIEVMAANRAVYIKPQ